MKYIPVIGMEVHVELRTKSKMFCSCKNGMGLEKQPNVSICPVCSGQPGTLPVPNRQAIEFVQLAGLALNCELRKKTKFDRKNYFYPDLPKGYQISQYDQPLCEKGSLNIGEKEIKITRIHLEEDTGKLIHPKGADYSLVDFNRAGVPLMELVTEPDIETGKEARLFCQKLRQICRYLGISNADMEKGHMRCEANISLMDTNDKRIARIKKELGDKISISDIRAELADISELYGTKVEVKNINSFKFVEKAINYEIKRQEEVLEKGDKVIQETRGWDNNRGATVSQRVKESAHDYRYFPEPDIPPFEFGEDYIESLKNKLPELPDQKISRFKKEYELSEDNAEILTSRKELADYFEEVISEIKEKIVSGEIISAEKKAVRLAANYIITELRKYLASQGQEIKDVKITPENYAELVGILADGKINSSAAQAVLKEMHKTGGDPSQIIETKGLVQMSDESELEEVIEKVVKNNSQSVEDYKNGKTNALQFLIGQVMSATKGKANPKVATELLKKKLK